MKSLNTNINKITWPTFINAVIVLINGRLPEAFALDASEQGYLMIIISALIVGLVPNKKEIMTVNLDLPKELSNQLKKTVSEEVQK